MRTLIVLTHKNVTDLTLLFYTNNWSHYFDRIIFISPEDSRFDIPNQTCLFLGKSEHHGKGLIERMILALQILYSLKSDLSCICEYDAVFTKYFQPDMITHDEFSGFRIQNIEPDFASDYYYHCPWVLGYNVIGSILKKDMSNIQSGYSDRWLGSLVDHNSFKPVLAYTRNTIEDRHMDTLFEFIKDGAQCIHGIKDIQLAQKILNAI